MKTYKTNIQYIKPTITITADEYVPFSVWREIDKLCYSMNSNGDSEIFAFPNITDLVKAERILDEAKFVKAAPSPLEYVENVFTSVGFAIKASTRSGKMEIQLKGSGETNPSIFLQILQVGKDVVHNNSRCNNKHCPCNE